MKAIFEMEMPESCVECRFCVSDGVFRSCYWTDLGLQETMYHVPSGKNVDFPLTGVDISKERAPFCPLKAENHKDLMNMLHRAYLIGYEDRAANAPADRTRADILMDWS